MKSQVGSIHLKVYQRFFVVSFAWKAKQCPFVPTLLKTCCYKCIRKWITETRSQCPHCRASLHIYELINCRWADEVTQQLDNLQSQATSSRSSGQGDHVVASVNATVTSNVDLCELHNERLSVFCSTCDFSICHQCALFDNKHEQHSFRPLEEVYNEHVKQIKNEMDQLKRRHLELISLFQDVEKNVQAVKQAKEERVRELRNAVELMVARLDSQLKSKLVTLMSQRSQLFQEIELLETLLQDVQSELDVATRSEMITKSSEILSMFNEVHCKPMASLVSAPIPADFVSEIVPPYESSTFTLQPYSIMNNELILCIVNHSTYEYRVEMVHQVSRDPSRNIVREFASHFEVGECWGYNRFFRLDLLVSEVSGKSTYILQKCRDQNWHISQLEANQGHCFAQLAELKERLSIEVARQANSTATINSAVVASSSTTTNTAVVCRESETLVDSLVVKSPTTSILPDPNTSMSVSMLPCSHSSSGQSTSVTPQPSSRPYSLNEDDNRNQRWISNARGEQNHIISIQEIVTTNECCTQVEDIVNPNGNNNSCNTENMNTTPVWQEAANMPVSNNSAHIESHASVVSSLLHNQNENVVSEEDEDNSIRVNTLSPRVVDCENEFNRQPTTLQPNRSTQFSVGVSEPILNFILTTNQPMNSSILSSLDMSQLTASYNSEDALSTNSPRYLNINPNNHCIGLINIINVKWMLIWKSSDAENSLVEEFSDEEHIRQRDEINEYDMISQTTSEILSDHESFRSSIDSNLLSLRQQQPRQTKFSNKATNSLNILGYVGDCKNSNNSNNNHIHKRKLTISSIPLVDYENNFNDGDNMHGPGGGELSYDYEYLSTRNTLEELLKLPDPRPSSLTSRPSELMTSNTSANNSNSNNNGKRKINQLSHHPLWFKFSSSASSNSRPRLPLNQASTSRSNQNSCLIEERLKQLKCNSAEHQKLSSTVLPHVDDIIQNTCTSDQECSPRSVVSEQLNNRLLKAFSESHDPQSPNFQSVSNVESRWRRSISRDANACSDNTLLHPKLCASSSSPLSSHSSSHGKTISESCLSKNKNLKVLSNHHLTDLNHKRQQQQQHCHHLQQSQQQQNFSSSRQLPYCHKEDGTDKCGHSLSLLAGSIASSTANVPAICPSSSLLSSSTSRQSSQITKNNLEKELLINSALPIAGNKDEIRNKITQNNNSGPLSFVDSANKCVASTSTTTTSLKCPNLLLLDQLCSLSSTNDSITTAHIIKNTVQNLENDIDEETMTGDRDVSEHILNNRRLWEDTNLTTGTINDSNSKPSSSSLLNNHENRNFDQSKLSPNSPRSTPKPFGININELDFNNTKKSNLSTTSDTATRKNIKLQEEINPRTMCNRLCFQAKRIHDALESGKFGKPNHGSAVMHNSNSGNIFQRQDETSNTPLRLDSVNTGEAIPSHSGLNSPHSIGISGSAESQKLSTQYAFTEQSNLMMEPDYVVTQTNDISEPADLSLAMLCHRISRLQTEAEAVAKAISVNGSIRNKQSTNSPTSNQHCCSSNILTTHEERSTITDLHAISNSFDNSNSGTDKIYEDNLQQLSTKSDEQSGHTVKSTRKIKLTVSF
ncbi:unnamed protein product [Heterobilharzia americana]|nr:unnamed protein product [Heterobilharzia americana]